MFPDLNSLWHNDAIWWHRSESKSAQITACGLMARNHYFYQYCLSNNFGRYRWPFSMTSYWLNKWLTHWGRDEMVAIIKTIFKCIFLRHDGFRLWFQVCYWGTNQKCPSTGSDDGLAPVRRQAIFWVNDGLVHWCIYASLGLNKMR